ncbi:hypothetical protein QR680_013176 [Steinernema hermaphroditum]|uniref:Uncharacterized protein n=1 Tax=Steinernema hermaphroditum TaxID=289476 RepID=A0AA39I673_9BILA|nr:hypothetical protein QR680_013176 [Steinernema hermaphroditum]
MSSRSVRSRVFSLPSDLPSSQLSQIRRLQKAAARAGISEEEFRRELGNYDAPYEEPTASEDDSTLKFLVKMLEHCLCCPQSGRCRHTSICSLLRNSLEHRCHRDPFCNICKQLFILTVFHQKRCHGRRHRKCQIRRCGFYKGPLAVDIIALQMIDRGILDPFIATARAAIRFRPEVEEQLRREHIEHEELIEGELV